MAFEDYKDLDLKPEKATREEIEQLSKKYGVSEFHDVILRVGIRCKGTDKVKFFMTDAEKELRELLKL